MNKIVTVPLAASFPATLPVAAAEPPKNGPLARAEQLVEILRNGHWADETKLDEAAAVRMLAYFRRRNVLDNRDQTEEEENKDTEILYRDVLPFFKRYNQSLDWVFFGDPSNLICICASHSMAARENGVHHQADAELLALAALLLKAEDDCLRLSKKVCQLEKENRNARCIPDVFEILNLRATDEMLGLPDPQLLGACNKHWNSASAVNALRLEKWKKFEFETRENEEITRTVMFTPSPKARARGDEIITAYDDFHAKQRFPRGYKKMSKELDRACREKDRLAARIYAMKATTLEGILAKIKCACVDQSVVEIENLDGNEAEDAMRSIFGDVQRLVLSLSV